MTELELYKFVQDKEIRWEMDKLLLWIPFNSLEEFTELIGYDYLSDDGGEKVYLQSDCIVVELNDICEVFEIEETNIVPKEK